MEQCRVHECERPIHLKRDKLCNAHYLQQRKGKPFGETRNTSPIGLRECSFAGCGKNQHSRGYCPGHYAQQRAGIPLRPLFSTMRTRGSLAIRDEHGRKECVNCKEWQDEEVFGPNKTNSDGLRSECRNCRADFYKSNRKRLVEERMIRHFNITVSQRDAMLAEQGGRCASCRTDKPGNKGWVVDHDHACCPESGRSCGKCIRGILCSRCNLTLGLVNDDVSILSSLASYLNATQARSAA